MSLSFLIITKNVSDVIGETLESAKGLWNELLVVDEYSTDKTIKIIKEFGGKIYNVPNKNIGERKQWLIDKAKSDWIMLLDSDERLSPMLYCEIKKLIKDQKEDGIGITLKNNYDVTKKKLGENYVAYRIPYQNYVFGKPVYWGGEKYSKVRVFRRGNANVDPLPLHEEIKVNGKIGNLNGKIEHYSYRTPRKLFSKFTRYATISAKEKLKAGEYVTLSKLFLYGPHMFYARFIKEQGFRDGWRGFVLAGAFAYMEDLTYWLLLIISIFQRVNILKRYIIYSK